MRREAVIYGIRPRYHSIEEKLCVRVCELSPQCFKSHEPISWRREGGRCGVCKWVLEVLIHVLAENMAAVD